MVAVLLREEEAERRLAVAEDVRLDVRDGADGGERVEVELEQRNGDVRLTVADDGEWSGETGDGTGLSIVRALVHDELKGTLSLAGERGLRAEVVFPA